MARVPSPVTEAEASRIRFFREKGVLEAIDSDRLPCQTGTLIVGCADGHHFGDLYAHHTQVCAHDADHPMHHPLLLNGGALLLPKDSPLLFVNEMRMHDDETLLRNIFDAIDIKEPTSIVLLSHAPCGMARAYAQSIDQCLDLLARAKDRVRSALEHQGLTINVAGHFHVYYQNRMRRSYHFNRKAWDAGMKPVA